MNLYELTTVYNNVQHLIENGEEGLEDTLDSIDAAREDKFENIGKVLRNLESKVEIFKTEEKRLAERRRTIENNIVRLKEYVKDNLQATGDDKVEAGTFTFTLRNNAPSVRILNDKDIPVHYYEEQTPKLDRRKLLNDLKELGDIPGAELQHTRSVMVR